MADTKRDGIGIAKNKGSMHSNDVALDQMQRRIVLMLRGGTDPDMGGPVGFCGVNILNLRSSVQILASYPPKTGWKCQGIAGYFLHLDSQIVANRTSVSYKQPKNKKKVLDVTMVHERKVVDEVSGWLRVYDDGSVDRTWVGPQEAKFMVDLVPSHENFVDGVVIRDVDPINGTSVSPPHLVVPSKSSSTVRFLRPPLFSVAVRHRIPAACSAANQPSCPVLSEGPSCIFVGPIESASQETLEALYRQARDAYYSGKPLIVDDMFDRVELKLRWYGSKYVVKYPRCSLRRQSTYADAQGRKTLHRCLLWLACGSSFLCLAAQYVFYPSCTPLIKLIKRPSTQVQPTLANHQQCIFLSY